MTVQEWIIELRRRHRENKILWSEECLQLAVDLELSLERNRDQLPKTPQGGAAAE